MTYIVSAALALTIIVFNVYLSASQILWGLNAGHISIGAQIINLSIIMLACYTAIFTRVKFYNIAMIIIMVLYIFMSIDYMNLSILNEKISPMRKQSHVLHVGVFSILGASITVIYIIQSIAKLIMGAKQKHF